MPINSTEELDVARREGRCDDAGKGAHVRGHPSEGADSGTCTLEPHDSISLVVGHSNSKSNSNTN